MSKRIVVLAMGGTIGGTSSDPGDNVGYQAATVGVNELFSAISGISDRLNKNELFLEQVAQIDSKDMTLDICRHLANRVCHYLAVGSTTGIVITHGTDTLEETAYFLDQVIPAHLIASKCVVMTCAMRPSTAQFPDGPLNILDSLTVASTVGARGILAVCAGKVFEGAQIQKVHPYRLDAFDAGEAGPVAFVEESMLRIVREWPEVNQRAHQFEFVLLEPVVWPRVELVFSYADADGMVIEAICQSRETEPRVSGIVVAGTGNGSIHQKLNLALGRAMLNGVRILRTTRCYEGSLVNKLSEKTDIAVARVSNPFKARIALTLDLLAEKRGVAS